MATVSAAFSAPKLRKAPPLSLSPKPILRILPFIPLTPRLLPSLRQCISYETFSRTPLPHVEDKDDWTSDIDDEEEEEELIEGALSVEEVREPEGSASVLPINSKKVPGLSLNLSVKEKKELASYAHSLGKKLKCQLVGKSGVNDNVAASFIETLEANELLKIKIHRTCPGELDDVVSQLEMLTGSVVVSQIGRTMIIYKPSFTKLKAEEKKKQQAKRVFMKRQTAQKPAFTMVK
ncbi:hypothetical protein SAY87_000288 [Trapa incisa]|uniref:CRM domain-containing protein n=1 Tax=Trapa incisa TaxID=236973 RepID=A0AAN7GT75_9MYRT|nr:hypothetical protein SAY87_000288 [Trapa incisa]